jgi:hypothetical protein
VPAPRRLARRCSGAWPFCGREPGTRQLSAVGFPTQAFGVLESRCCWIIRSDVRAGRAVSCAVSARPRNTLGPDARPCSGAGTRPTALLHFEELCVLSRLAAEAARYCGVCCVQRPPSAVCACTCANTGPLHSTAPTCSAGKACGASQHGKMASGHRAFLLLLAALSALATVGVSAAGGAAMRR